MLEIRDLCVSYGAVNALESVSFRAEPGAITAVLGANGAGKTTLLRCITGLVKARSGSVKFKNREMLGVAVEDIARSGVSHVPEGRGVIEELTVDENLRLATLWGIPRSKRKEAIAEMKDLFPALATLGHRHASTLSGGERQMLAIGRALISHPELLLLDEPSLGLAPLVTNQLMAMLKTEVSASEMSVVLVEQNARSALSVADNAVVLNLGEVVISDSADVVASDAELRRHYLGF